MFFINLDEEELFFGGFSLEMSTVQAGRAEIFRPAGLRAKTGRNWAKFFYSFIYEISKFESFIKF